MSTRVSRFGRSIGLALLAVSLLVATTAAHQPGRPRPWKFGVMADTQWTVAADPAGENPNGVAVSIIRQLNEEFIRHGVKFVLQVGDLTENGNDADIATRAAAAQTLYDAGIGFFPMRGNHETYASPANDYGIDAFRLNFPQAHCGGPRVGVRNCDSPVLNGAYPDDLEGMSYSFDYGQGDSSARFVVIDDWATPHKRADAAGYPYGYSIADQQAWIDARLNRATRRTEHAFVFSHQNLIGENHQDSLFSGYTNANPDVQNAFFSSLQANGVRYYICGHDHIHQRSIVASPDGQSAVQELIAASNSSKFYTPKALTDEKWYGQKSRETSVSQERYSVGYYIVTVDGPRVTIDYYSDDHGNWQSDAKYPDGCAVAATCHVTPSFDFVKRETWGYSVNGREFLVAQGESFRKIVDRFGGTVARVLGGVNGSTATDYTGRAFTKTVDTGWSIDRGDLFASDILTLWGMDEVAAATPDVYTLSLSYDSRWMRSPHLLGGRFAIASQDEDGNWVNAVDLNAGAASVKKFVLGPWKAEYGLGTYGVDPSTRTAWAVVNYTGNFAVARAIEPRPPHRR
jgi:hypothetical protein